MTAPLDASTPAAATPPVAGASARLADLTTLRVGGPARSLVRATTEGELIDAVRAADADGVPVLVLGGGSNLLVADEGFDGVVVQDVRSGVTVDMVDSCGGGSFRVPAGHSWDALVEQAVAERFVGLEALSGIPGTVGAAPVQNIGAYGQEVAGVISTVRVYDRVLGRARLLAVGELGLGYRTSLLKRSMHQPDDDGRVWTPSPRYVVLEVAFQTRLGTLSPEVAYPELARRLGVEVGTRAEIAQVRAAVLELRAGKGMLAGPASDHDTWSAGSFFMNPVVRAADAASLPEGAPRFEVRSSLPEVTTGPALGAVDASLVKTSAAWLIERAGFGKGFGVHGEESRARLSTKHALALTNRGQATAADVVELARAVRDGVRDAFGIELVPEPVMVGVTL
ncbi:UDP-N-acetylmuramate dehydrogenase [Sanguibacter hominis ATCC BAA-789]|uniref:UDP-N-acetylenolpyruvoylglucosamine reductase n=1 Tax=Sanguibacter hominis ATCC BAA-789 TaxID=1312740 RepID=A0A9X5FHP8_9MICO|nr:UDP-N-acetylmuramate dehydrogenase [Sanguibacter hominis]NKX92273.1 UDP-N-acetylmuramate dehydrogenase [Sanguibacter hominis ATCC BAA-789]